MISHLALDEPQAGLLLAASVCVADDELSPAEAVVLRKYFTRATATALGSLLEGAGARLPRDLPGLEPAILACLKGASEASRLWSLAVALELALADSRVDQEELRLLARYASALGLGMAEIERYRSGSLRESEAGAPFSPAPPPPAPLPPLALELSPREARAALVTLVAAADDRVSEAELAFIREYCSLSDFEGLTQRLKAAGGAWPGDLGRCQASILGSLRGMDRKLQLGNLVLAYRTALADGAPDPGELRLIKEFCEALQIGFGELEACAPALESLLGGR